MINAIIMASGFSSRMGQNKLLLQFNSKPLIEHILDKLLLCGFCCNILVAQNKRILEIGEKKGMKTVYNSKAYEGQSQSIKLGILNSPEALGYAFFTADQPLINTETIKFLMKKFYKYKDSIIVPCFKGRRGSPVIFPRAFIDELLALKGDIGGKAVINKHLESVKFIEVTKDYFLWDIDTEDDYRRLLKIDDLNVQRDD